MSDQSGAKPRGGILKWALWGAALLGVAAVLYIMVKASTKPPEVKTQRQAEAEAQAAPMKSVMEKFEQAEGAGAAPDYVFRDPKGQAIRLADLKGKVVVMNLWATWCGPCKVEMPTLAALAEAYQGKPVEVVTISVDKDQDVEKARAFIASHAPLKFYSDPEAKLPWQIAPPIKGMPTTFIYGKDGRERGRVSGEANWAGPDARVIVDRILAEG